MRPPIALHPLDVPVLNLQQAKAAVESVGAWDWVASGDAQAKSLQPIVGNWPETKEQLREWATRRLVEAYALRLWDFHQRLAAAPELGLSDAAHVVQYELLFHFNGPDDPPSYSFAREVFGPECVTDPSTARQAFRRAMAYCGPDDPDSPLYGALRCVANTPNRRWILDVRSLSSLRESLMTPEHWAVWRAREMDEALAPACPQKQRPRM